MMHLKNRFYFSSLTAFILFFTLFVFPLFSKQKKSKQVEYLTLKVLSTLAHDSSAFTQGLLFSNGGLYESTGHYGQSTLRLLNPATGQMIRHIFLPVKYFGEGIAKVGDFLFQLTWKEGIAFVYDSHTLHLVKELTYEGEGWGLCSDGTKLFMSDGSDQITVRNPENFAVIKRYRVSFAGKPIFLLNDLECVENSLYANIWGKDTIVRFDKETGQVTAFIDAKGLLSLKEKALAGQDGVLNGIAYNPFSKSFFITGKLWPYLFEVQFVPSGIRN